MENRDWVWAILIVVSQLVLWRIYSIHLWRERRLHRRRLEVMDKQLEWYEARNRIT